MVRPSPKLRGSGQAVGYWGSDPHRHVAHHQVIEKTRVLLGDQIWTGGVKTALWQGVVSTTPNALQCSCYKEASESPDKRCRSCYGEKYIPGFLKFGYSTIWAASISGGLTLTNVEQSYLFKPNRIVLEASEVSGTLETPDYAYANSLDVTVWEYDDVSNVRDSAESSLQTEYSIDGGISWLAISNLSVAAPMGSGNIRFRVTFTRTAASVVSPSFEILRVRFPTVAVSPDGRSGPFILILKTVPMKEDVRAQYGNTEEESNTKYWTAPLYFFDRSITINSADERLHDSAFIEMLEGHHSGVRYVLTNDQHDDPISFITRQLFGLRKTQENEIYGLVL